MHLSIPQKRKHIYDKFKGVNVTQMTDQQLNELFRMYDYIFFNGRITHFFQTHTNHQLSIQFDNFGQSGQKRNFGENGEIIDTEGISGHSLMETNFAPETKYVHRIFISRPIFSQLFNNGENRECSNGLVCHNQLQCLQLTLEHEITHLIMDLFYPSLQNGHGDDFQKMVQHLFGQTQVQHTLGHQCQ